MPEMHVIRPHQPLLVVPYTPEADGAPDIEAVRAIVQYWVEPLFVVYKGKERRAYVEGDGRMRELLFNPEASRLGREEILGTLVIVVAD